MAKKIIAKLDIGFLLISFAAFLFMAIIMFTYRHKISKIRKLSQIMELCKGILHIITITIVFTRYHEERIKIQIVVMFILIITICLHSFYRNALVNGILLKSVPAMVSWFILLLFRIIQVFQSNNEDDDQQIQVIHPLGSSDRDIQQIQQLRQRIHQLEQESRSLRQQLRGTILDRNEQRRQVELVHSQVGHRDEIIAQVRGELDDVIGHNTRLQQEVIQLKASIKELHMTNRRLSTDKLVSNMYNKVSEDDNNNKEHDEDSVNPPDDFWDSNNTDGDDSD